MVKDIYYGAHISGTTTDSIIEGAKNVYKLGGNIVQIFLGNKKENLNISIITKFFSDNSMKLVIHAPYTINIARDFDEYSWWIIELIDNIKYAHKLKAYCVVLHFGKLLDLSLNEGYNNMLMTLLYIHDKTKKYINIKILLETPAGQGSELCYKIKDLSNFYKKISSNNNKQFKNRFKLCIDTCHLFSAGYDLRTLTKIKIFLESFDELIGIDNIQLVHLNDSKTDLNSNIDRHESIGKGKIGIFGLKSIFDYFTSIHIPIILETSDKYLKNDFKLLTK